MGLKGTMTVSPFSRHQCPGSSMVDMEHTVIYFLYPFQGSRGDQERLLLVSTTLYVGNMSFYTTEEQVHELFGRCGDVKRIVMGLDKFKKTPCGFCFVEYPFKECSIQNVITLAWGK